jgi:hypothetical protein
MLSQQVQKLLHHNDSLFHTHPDQRWSPPSYRLPPFLPHPYCPPSAWVGWFLWSDVGPRSVHCACVSLLNIGQCLVISDISTVPTNSYNVNKVL